MGCHHSSISEAISTRIAESCRISTRKGTKTSHATLHSQIPSQDGVHAPDNKLDTILDMVSTVHAPIDPGMFILSKHGEFEKKYLIKQKLGSGAYADVLYCRDRESHADRAVKKLRCNKIDKDSLKRILAEIAVVKQLDHPNIVKLYEVFTDNSFIYIVTELYTGGELFDEIVSQQKFTEADASRTMRQIISGVSYLHKYRIVHRDLKPENLLLESKAKDAKIKIIDFGLSSFFDPQIKMKERLGTAYYVAPEVLKQTYDEKCDVWSMGVILYILLCGYPPFSGHDDSAVLKNVEKGKIRFETQDWRNISQNAKDLVTKMLTLNPTKRITAEEALRHPWIEQAMLWEKNVIERSTLVNALGNIRQFQASQKLSQAALLYIASQLTTLEEKKELTKVFCSLDVNGDGQLDRKELMQGYNQFLGLTESSPCALSQEEIASQVDSILDFVDLDRNGLVDYSEFLTAAMDKTILLSPERLKGAFSLFDLDSSGAIASEELRQILVGISDEHWKEIINEADRNHDGVVDFNEFTAMMNKLCGEN